MNDKTNDTILSGPKPPQPRGAEQPSLLQSEPSSPAAGGTTILQIAVPSAAVDTVQHVLAEAGDLIDAIIGAATPAPAAKKTSHPAAQGLVAGLLRGLGEKYQDQDLVSAGLGLQAKVLGLPVAAAKPIIRPSKPFKGNPRNKARKNKRKR